MRQMRIGRHNRLVYYGEKADNPEFWSDYWSSSPIEQRLDKAKEDNSPAYRSLLEILTRHLPKKGRILEGGCGIGEIVFALQSRGYEVEGVEFSERVVEAVKNAKPGINIVVGDIRNLDYPDGYFAAYISVGVVEHFEEGPERALHEAKRVLRNGGLLLVGVPFYNPLRKIKTTLFRPVYTRATRGDFYQFAFTASGFSDILLKTGFRIEAIYPYDSISGLKAEIPGLKYILAEGVSPVKMLWFIQSSLAIKHFCGHMILFVAQKGF